MSEIREERAEDRPPSYEKALGLKNSTAATEILPEYTRYSIQQDPQIKKSAWKRYGIWIACFALGILAILGGIAGTILQKKAIKRSNEVTTTDRSPFPNVTSLASAECGSGSFIFYQTNSSTIYVRGRFRNRPSNITGSDYVLTYLDLKGVSAPMLRTNLTAVCSMEAVTPGARIYLYYWSDRQYHYTLNEAIFSLPYGIQDFNSPVPLSVYTTVTGLVNQTAPSSLSAVYVPSSGPKLYYFSKTMTGPTYLYEISRSLWPSSTASTINNELYGPIRDLGAPLAALFAEPYPDLHTGLQEISIFFADADKHLSRLVFTRYDGWMTKPQKLATMYSGQYISGTMNSIAAVIPHVYGNATAPLLYYVSEGRVNQISSDTPLPPSFRPKTLVNFTVSDHSVQYNFPSAVAEPGLIAASAWNERWNRSMSIDAIGNDVNYEGVESLYIFFVKLYGAPVNRGEEYLFVQDEGFGVLNVTGKARVFGGFS